ncbi:epsin-1 [Triticum aestivum]|uniref:epsin-1 n=1 Tax=Triticum aestivum TaxID=4565 RepID=UPI0008429841|nr:epsin-1-like [Triticum aestivum]
MLGAARGGSTCPRPRCCVEGIEASLCIRATWPRRTGQMLPIRPQRRRCTVPPVRGPRAASGERIFKAGAGAPPYSRLAPLSALRSRSHPILAAPPMPTDHGGSSDGGHQAQCRHRGASVDVELRAAMALADMAGAGAGAAADHALPAQHLRHAAAPAAQAAMEQEDEELASTRLSLELGNVGIQSSPCSSSSSGAGQQPPQSSAAVTGYGLSRPRHMLTEAEKEAKRLRRVLANRESARQTILRRQAIRDELARKVADLASQNENMKKEKDMVLEQYLTLKETNKQLKQQVAKTTKKKPSSTPAITPMDIAPPAQSAEATPPQTPPQPSFLYSAPPTSMPVPYVWGSWPPCGPGVYEHGGNPAGMAGHAPPPLCVPPACAWYYPVVAAATDPRGSPPAYVQPFQEPTGSGGTAGEDTDDDPCSLTLAIDAADKKSPAACPNAYQSGSGVVGAVGLQVALSGREKAATAAEARKRRKELTKLKQMHAGSRHGAGEHW